MNSLTQYNSVRSQLRAGDVVVFWGTPWNALTAAIELESGGPSHSALVRQPLDDQGNDVIISECTRPLVLKQGARNGVQHNPLGEVLQNYGPDVSAAALLLSDSARARLDLFKFYEFIGKCDGIVTYDVGDLFRFILRDIPVAGTREWQDEDFARMVCSGFVTATHIADQILGPGINWTEWAPQNLVQAKMYKGWVPLLGNPKLKRFNSL